MRYIKWTVCKNPAAGAKKKETTSKILLSRPVSDKQQQNAKAKSKNASHTVYLHKMSEVDGRGGGPGGGRWGWGVPVPGAGRQTGVQWPTDKHATILE